MKRSTAKTILALALAVVLTLGLCAPALAAKTVLSKQSLTVNGEAVNCQKYNIDGYNYFKLRDLAKLLDGTESQFNVDYDKAANSIVITTGSAYTTPDGTELKIGEDLSAKAKLSPQSLIIDGEEYTDLTAYNIGGSNYFQLRELGKVLHFYVHYDQATNTAQVDEQNEEEAWDTGDAGLDDPRNADGIKKNEVLVVSFGTSFNDSRVATIGAIEAAMEKAFPGYSVRRGFTADTIINHVYVRDDEKIDNVTEAIERAIKNGVENLLVQPTHLMHGYEYDDLVAELARYTDSFDSIVIGAPLLTDDEDFEIVMNTITEATKEYVDKDTAICFMGHGTSHEYNFVYAKMQQLLNDNGYDNYYIGTVESTPTLQDVVDQVKAAGYKKVVLEPLMIVAGDHAHNDMDDGDDPESWRSLFEAEGIEVRSILRGLGEFQPIQDLLVEHLKAAITETLEEDFTTGDASKDNPRNQDNIGEKELLVVSFGTSFNDNRVATIGAIENALEKAFPGLSVRRGFTADTIIHHVYDRDGELIDNIQEALDRAVANGVKELYVQPTHLMHGYEYDDVIAALAPYSDSFEIKVGEPLLTSHEDFRIVMNAIVEATAQYDDGKTAIVFMGHGTSHEYNKIYPQMQQLLKDSGYENYFIGTVEAEPSVEDALELVQAGNYERVVLRPLMIVAGDHANNDMYGDEEDSWKVIFQNAGYEVIGVLEGLGQLPAIQDLFVEHVKAMLEEEKVEYPATREMASKTAARTSVLEEGMVPVTADKLADGTYTVKLKVSSTMFTKAETATLTVKDGKMTAVFAMGSDSQPWLFVGDKDALASAPDSALIPMVDSTFTVPVEALDAEIIVCSYSKNSKAWYERSILFQANSLPDEAFTEKPGTDPASLGLADGEYTVEVALGGGSGKTSITSPAKLTVKDGKLTATIVFSSSKYDWVKLGGTQYDAVTTDPGSTFELPVDKLDSNIAIIGHTTAMGGQEISYTLNFNSASIK